MVGRTPGRDLGREKEGASRPTSPPRSRADVLLPATEQGRGQAERERERGDIVVVENYGERDIPPTSTLGVVP